MKKTIHPVRTDPKPSVWKITMEAVAIVAIVLMWAYILAKTL